MGPKQQKYGKDVDNSNEELGNDVMLKAHEENTCQNED